MIDSRDFPNLNFRLGWHVQETMTSFKKQNISISIYTPFYKLERIIVHANFGPTFVFLK